MKIHESGATLQTRGPIEQKEAAKPGEAKRVAPRPGRLSSTKVHEQHLARLAIVYVRQSTTPQVDAPKWRSLAALSFAWLLHHPGPTPTSSGDCGICKRFLMPIRV